MSLELVNLEATPTSGPLMIVEKPFFKKFSNNYLNM